MHIYESIGDTVKEIYGYYTPFNCLPDQISNVLGIEKDYNLHKVLMTIAKCKITGAENYRYFAWLQDKGFYISIRYAKKNDPYSSKEPQLGMYIDGFYGDKINPDEVESSIINSIFHYWIEMAETANKEISHLFNTVR